MYPLCVTPWWYNFPISNASQKNKKKKQQIYKRILYVKWHVETVLESINYDVHICKYIHTNRNDCFVIVESVHIAFLQRWDTIYSLILLWLDSWRQCRFGDERNCIGLHVRLLMILTAFQTEKRQSRYLTLLIVKITTTFLFLFLFCCLAWHHTSQTYVSKTTKHFSISSEFWWY